MLKTQQLSSFVAVYEEGSFSRAAIRENATQSGLSMQIQKLETQLQVSLFDRSQKGIKATVAGKRFYRRAINILRNVKMAEMEAQASRGTVQGKIRAGILPAFTQSIIASTLVEFNDLYSDIEVSILEGFSPLLMDAVLRGEVDFAIIPIDTQRKGGRYRHFATDREVLVSNAGSELPHLEPVQAAQLQSQKLVLPTRGNARRDRLDRILFEKESAMPALLEMDSMAAALELVANSDWMTILPAVMCGRDLSSRRRKLHPIESPNIAVDYMVVEPQTAVTSHGASLFLETLKNQFQKIGDRWSEVYPDF